MMNDTPHTSPFEQIRKVSWAAVEDHFTHTGEMIANGKCHSINLL